MDEERVGQDPQTVVPIIIIIIIYVGITIKKFHSLIPMIMMQNILIYFKVVN
jgi:hypothetical protein